MLRREQVSTPLVGSSRTTVLDEPRKAMPMDSRLLRPPERAWVCVCWCGLSPTSPRVLKWEQGRSCARASGPHPEVPARMATAATAVSVARSWTGAPRPPSAAPSQQWIRADQSPLATGSPRSRARQALPREATILSRGAPTAPACPKHTAGPQCGPGHAGREEKAATGPRGAAGAASEPCRPPS